MQTHKSNQCRKSSVTLAAISGTAVCLGGMGGVAHAVTGNITSSNTDTHFDGHDPLKIFGSLASWYVSGGAAFCTLWAQAGNPLMNPDGQYFKALNSGVTVSSGMAGGFVDTRYIPFVTDKYIGVKFNSGGVKFGWVHVVSTGADSSSINVDKWGYDQTGGTIRTLATSVTAHSLNLSDGRVQLHWQNKNEQGVSRYVVQRKNAAGGWDLVATEAPGAGKFSYVAPRPADYRVVVERMDGSTEEVSFRAPGAG